MGRLPLAAGSLSPCSARLLSQGTMPATVSDVRCRRLRCRLWGSNQCDNYAGIEPTSGYSRAPPTSSRPYCTGPSIIYIPHCVLDRNCALGVLRCFLHYYFGAVALYITQNRVGAASLSLVQQRTICVQAISLLGNLYSLPNYCQSLLHVLTCLPAAPWSRLMGRL